MKNFLNLDQTNIPQKLGYLSGLIDYTRYLSAFGGTLSGDLNITGNSISYFNQNFIFRNSNFYINSLDGRISIGSGLSIINDNRRIDRSLISKSNFDLFSIYHGDIKLVNKNQIEENKPIIFINSQYPNFSTSNINFLANSNCSGIIQRDTNKNLIIKVGSEDDINSNISFIDGSYKSLLLENGIISFASISLKDIFYIQNNYISGKGNQLNIFSFDKNLKNQYLVDGYLFNKSGDAQGYFKSFITKSVSQLNYSIANDFNYSYQKYSEPKLYFDRSSIHYNIQANKRFNSNESNFSVNFKKYQFNSAKNHAYFNTGENLSILKLQQEVDDLYTGNFTIYIKKHGRYSTINNQKLNIIKTKGLSLPSANRVKWSMDLEEYSGQNRTIIEKNNGYDFYKDIIYDYTISSGIKEDEKIYTNSIYLLKFSYDNLKQNNSTFAKYIQGTLNYVVNSASSSSKSSISSKSSKSSNSSISSSKSMSSSKSSKSSMSSISSGTACSECYFIDGIRYIKYPLSFYNGKVFYVDVYPGAANSWLYYESGGWYTNSQLGGAGSKFINNGDCPNREYECSRLSSASSSSRSNSSSNSSSSSSSSISSSINSSISSSSSLSSKSNYSSSSSSKNSSSSQSSNSSTDGNTSTEILLKNGCLYEFGLINKITSQQEDSKIFQNAALVNSVDNTNIKFLFKVNAGSGNIVTDTIYNFTGIILNQNGEWI